jgi:hypothetical protein
MCECVLTICVSVCILYTPTLHIHTLPYSHTGGKALIRRRSGEEQAWRLPARPHDADEGGVPGNPRGTQCECVCVRAFMCMYMCLRMCAFMCMCMCLCMWIIIKLLFPHINDISPTHTINHTRT